MIASVDAFSTIASAADLRKTRKTFRQTGFFAAAMLPCRSRDSLGQIGDTSELCQTSLREAVHRYGDKLREGLTRA
jgi:hypothetical protein